MIYSKSYCPYCKAVIDRCTNPTNEIAVPFERCRFCKRIYLNSRKEEWITKSPFRRFMYFIPSGVWARAIMLSLLFFLPLMCLLSVFFDMSSLLIGILCLCHFLLYMVGAYFVRANYAKESIELSLKRTSDENYLKLLEQAGYTIYPLENEDTLS